MVRKSLLTVFCSNEYFEHKFPIYASLMTRWSQRVSEARMEKLLEEAIKAGLEIGILKKTSISKLNVDTTIQEKAISFPTDSKLYHSMREKLVDLSKEYGIKLCQSYTRKSKYSLVMRSCYALGQMKISNKELKILKNHLGRVVQDIERKVVGNEKLRCVLPSHCLWHNVY